MGSVAFGAIAGDAQQLDIRGVVAAAFRQRRNVVDMVSEVKISSAIWAASLLGRPDSNYVRCIERAFGIILACAVCFYDGASLLSIAGKPITIPPVDFVFVSCTIFLFRLQQAKFAQPRIKRAIRAWFHTHGIELSDRFDLFAFGTTLQPLLDKPVAPNGLGIALLPPAFFAPTVMAAKMPGVFMEGVKGKSSFTLRTLFHGNTSASVSAVKGRKPVQKRAFGPSPYSPTGIIT
jgi:hypothetical protein